MTTVFFVLFSWYVMTAKKRQQLVAATLAGVVVVMVVTPRPVFAQGLWGAIQAVLSVINGIIQTALTAINNVRTAMMMLYESTVWPQQLISQARMLVTQMITQYRGPMATIFNTNLSSATLAPTRGLEAVIRNAQSGDFSALSANYTLVYGPLPNPTAASAPDRTLIDMDDALAQGTLKTLKASDNAVTLTLGVANQIEDGASQAAPGSAPFITATAVAASVRSQAITQKMLASDLREEAARLAHMNALRKRGATFTSQFGTEIQQTLQPQ